MENKIARDLVSACIINVFTGLLVNVHRDNLLDRSRRKGHDHGLQEVKGWIYDCVRGWRERD
jgi:hypothetical protein